MGEEEEVVLMLDKLFKEAFVVKGEEVVSAASTYSSKLLFEARERRPDEVMLSLR